MRVDRRTFIIGTLAASAPAQGQPPILAGRLVVTGSSTVAPLVLELAKAFEKRHARVRIDVQAGGSSRGIADARSGLANIGMASRDLFDSERDLFGSPIARDGICLVTHKSNRLSSLSDDQVKALFKGQVTDWKDVGGAPGRITIVSKAEGRSTLELFLQHYKLKNSDIKASVIIGDNAQGIKTIAGNPNALGYVSVGAAEFEATQGTAIKLIASEGVTPSSVAVQNGTFPLSRPLTLVTRQAPAGLTAAFIAFARSHDAHPLVREQFFVPLQS